MDVAKSMETMKEQLVYWFFVIARLIFVLINNFYCIPTYLFWIVVLFRPLKYANETLYRKIENILYEWLHCMVAAWSWGAGYHIEEVGEDVSSCYNDESLIIANHQSTADVPMLMHCFQGKPKLTQHLSWIMDKMFKWTNFGLVSYVHGDFFIASGKNVRAGILDVLREYLTTIFQTYGFKWIILFPEGGFLYKRKDSSQEYARKNNFPILNNVSLPRIGALQEILTTLSEKVLNKLVKCNNEVSVQPRPLKWVIDITIAYPDGKPLDFLMITGKTVPPCKVVMHYRCFPAIEVPTESEQLTKWLNDRWIEKDLMLEEYYKTGKFPDSFHSSGNQSNVDTNSLSKETLSHKPIRKEPHKITLSWTWIYFLHFFFIISSLFHYILIKNIWQLVTNIF